MSIPSDTHAANYRVEVREHVETHETLVVLVATHGRPEAEWLHIAFTPTMLVNLLHELDKAGERAWGEDWVAKAVAQALGWGTDPEEA